MLAVSELTEMQSGVAGLDDGLMQKLRRVQILQTLPESELQCLQDAQAGDARSRGVHGAPGGDGDASSGSCWRASCGSFPTLPDGGEQVWATLPAGTALGELPLLANVPELVERADDGGVGCCCSWMSSSSGT